MFRISRMESDLIAVSLRRIWDFGISVVVTT